MHAEDKGPSEGENANVRISGSHPVLAVHDLDRSGSRELALRSLDGHRFMLGQPIKPT
jgi:hypothetical protein